MTLDIEVDFSYISWRFFFIFGLCFTQIRSEIYFYAIFSKFGVQTWKPGDFANLQFFYYFRCNFRKDDAIEMIFPGLIKIAISTYIWLQVINSHGDITFYVKAAEHAVQ